MIERYDELSLKQIGKIIKKRLGKAWDMNMCVSGFTGVGKSTIAVQLGPSIDPKFDLEKNVLYIPKAEDVIPKFNSLNPGQCLLLDETTRAIHRHQWFNPLLQELTRHYDTERYKRIATLFCIPRFFNMSENFRNNRIILWLHVLDRGVASLNMRDDQKYENDPWRQKENIKVYQQQSGGTNILNMDVSRKIRAESKGRNFVGIIYFDDLEPDIKERYERLKIESRKKMYAEKGDKETPLFERYKNTVNQRNILIKLLKEKAGMSDTEIGEPIGLQRVQVGNARKKVIV